MLKNFILLISVLFFTSCSSEYDEKLKISATTWIGYTPLFYAKETGLLEPLNIKLVNVSSLSENMYLYKAGNSDAYVGTQYEYSILCKEDSTLIPVMMFDRSFGGDIIMSNISIQELQNTKDSIDAYLEMDSINSTLLEDFIKRYKLQDKTINYINQDQAQISTLNSKNINKPTVVVTYTPYNHELIKKGFKEIVSTRDGLGLLVVDAMFTKKNIFDKHKKQFIELKKSVDIAIAALKKDPKSFYEIIKPYMLNMDYDEFNDSVNSIIWINESMSADLKQRLKDADFPDANVL